MNDPILQNLTGMTFLMTAESGIIINNFSRGTSRTRDNVYNAALGYTVGFVSYDPVATYNIKGRTTADTGIVAAAPGIALSIAGRDYGNGVGTTSLNAGGIYTDTTSRDHAEKGFLEFTVTATQMPGIP